MDCPHQRRADPEEAPGPRVERIGDVWRIRSAEAARQVLRARGATTQAGFTAEYIPDDVFDHHPILFSDGAGHDAQRKELGRFLSPAVVDRRYRNHIEAVADRYVATVRRKGVVDVDEMTLYYTVEVTAGIVGLTESRTEPMARRLVRFFNQPPFDITQPLLGRTRRQWLQAAWNGLLPIARFWFADVRPAIRARRRTPGEDIISHLIAEEYSNLEILVEAMTYGTAGMVTTREYIAMAAWHLLDDDALRARYLAAEEDKRHAILHEIIRLEPVVGHLYRRAQRDIDISDGDDSWTIPAGALIDLAIRPANADPALVGACPEALRPGRELPRGVSGAVLTFGDGSHKCPGQPLAIAEADALLTRLLVLEPSIVAEPSLGWDELVAGYEIRGLRIRVGDRAAADGASIPG